MWLPGYRGLHRLPNGEKGLRVLGTFIVGCLCVCEVVGTAQAVNCNQINKVLLASPMVEPRSLHVA